MDEQTLKGLRGPGSRARMGANDRDVLRGELRTVHQRIQRHGLDTLELLTEVDPKVGLTTRHLTYELGHFLLGVAEKVEGVLAAQLAAVGSLKSYLAVMVEARRLEDERAASGDVLEADVVEAPDAGDKDDGVLLEPDELDQDD